MGTSKIQNKWNYREKAMRKHFATYNDKNNKGKNGQNY
jgi:hypothetical protein